MRRGIAIFIMGTSSLVPASILRRPLATLSTQKQPPWKYLTIEWSPRISKLCESDTILLDTASHFVFPDLPQSLNSDHRSIYLQQVPPEKRFQTLSACHHDTWQSLVNTARKRLQYREEDAMDYPKGKLLVVGGNQKSNNAISSEEALRVLKLEFGGDVELWAAADPNDPQSPVRVRAKAEAGASGFLTQPLLSSCAWKTLVSYETNGTPIIVGIACPKSANSLQFWRQLMDQPKLLDQDPLFQSHIAYFSQQYTTPLAWIGREVQQVLLQSTSDQSNNHIDGLHFMPLNNTADMITLIKTLSQKATFTKS